MVAVGHIHAAQAKPARAIQGAATRNPGHFTKDADRDKAFEIYLTEEKLQALYEMPLTGKKDHIRDVFLIGCYTCQRVSDYNNLNAETLKPSARAHASFDLSNKRPRPK